LFHQIISDYESSTQMWGHQIELAWCLSPEPKALADVTNVHFVHSGHKMAVCSLRKKVRRILCLKPRRGTVR
jgi:hypothetical protein